jgi:hypothetical protein
LGPFLAQDLHAAIVGPMHARANKATAACLDRSGPRLIQSDRPRPATRALARPRAGHRAPGSGSGVARGGSPVEVIPQCPRREHERPWGSRAGKLGKPGTHPNGGLTWRWRVHLAVVALHGEHRSGSQGGQEVARVMR